MAFHVPTDSLARRYHGAYRLFTWEGARGPSGVKILPEIREQLGGKNLTISHLILQKSMCQYITIYIPP